MKKIYLIILIILIVGCSNVREGEVVKVKPKKINGIFEKESTPESKEEIQEQEELFIEKIIWTITSGAVGMILIFKLKKNKFI
jgi:hypothetical protein